MRRNAGLDRLNHLLIAAAALADRQEAMLQAADSSGAEHRSYAEAMREYHDAQRRYQEQASKVLRQEVVRVQRETHAAMEKSLNMQRDAPAGWLGVTFSGS